MVAPVDSHTALEVVLSDDDKDAEELELPED
jgi:hypothetical protein